MNIPYPHPVSFEDAVNSISDELTRVKIYHKSEQPRAAIIVDKDRQYHTDFNPTGFEQYAWRADVTDHFKIVAESYLHDHDTVVFYGHWNGSEFMLTEVFALNNGKVTYCTRALLSKLDLNVTTQQTIGEFNFNKGNISQAVQYINDTLADNKAPIVCSFSNGVSVFAQFVVDKPIVVEDKPKKKASKK